MFCSLRGGLRGLKRMLRYSRHDGHRAQPTSRCRVSRFEPLEDRSLLAVISVTIDPGDYAGEYKIDGGAYVGGLQEVQLDAETDHSLRIGGLGPGFYFTVGADGWVTSENTVAALGGMNTLSFNTNAITIDPSQFAGAYDVWLESDFVIGPTQLTLVPSITYKIRLAGSTDSLRFSVDGNGRVISENPAAASGVGGTLVFNTVPVSINPGDFVDKYTYTWSNGFHGRVYYSGASTLHLPPAVDNYVIELGGAGQYRGITFSVDDNGNVISENAAAAVGVDNALVFNTVPITINAGSFVGHYNMAWHTTRYEGVNTLDLPPGISMYVMRLGGSNSGIRFSIDDNGNVISENAAAAVGDGNTLTFNTVPITIDPGCFPGDYRLSPYGAPVGVYLDGVSTMNLPPGVDKYIIVLGGSNAGIQFSVDDNGNVVSNNLAAAAVVDGKLTFNTTVINVDPGDYTDQYYLRWTDTKISGPGQLMVVPNVSNYWFMLYPGGAYGRFSVSAEGQPSPSTLTVDGHPFVLTAAPRLDPIDDPEAINEDAGPQTVNLTGIAAGGAGPTEIQVIAVSDNTALIPHPTVDYASPATTGSLSYTPAENQHGTANVTVTVTDGGPDGVLGTGDDGSVSRQFLVTVNPVNDAPTVASPIGNVMVDEDAADTEVGLFSVFSDVDVATNSDALTFAVQSNSNPALVNAIIAEDLLTLDFQFNAFGTAEVVIRATDIAGLYVEDTIAVTVNEVSSAELPDLVANAIAAGETDVEASAEPGDINQWIEVIGGQLPSNSGEVVEIVLNLANGNFGLGRNVVVPEGYTLVINGKNHSVVFEGSSPALILQSGRLRLEGGVVFTNSTDSPTIQIEDGFLTLRDITVKETFGGEQAGVEILGGAADFGTTDDAGGNAFLVYGSGHAIRNLSAGPVSAIGNTFEMDESPASSSYRIEDLVHHALDDEGLGLVSFQAGEVYVTGDSGSVQRGVDAVELGGVVNVEAGIFQTYNSADKPVTVSFDGGPTLVFKEDLLDGGTTLLVEGTDADERILFSSGEAAGEIDVKYNGFELGTHLPNGRLVAEGRAGNDDIQAAGSIGLAVWFYGQDGHDRLKGGGGDDVLLGGDGDDLLVGQSGRDVLVGGTGADRIVGNSDDDILVAGWLAFADMEAALLGIRREWLSDHDYHTRVENLSGVSNGGLNDGYYLISDQSVKEDSDEDRLTGSAGLDWFFLDQNNDRATDLKDEVFANDLDWIL